MRVVLAALAIAVPVPLAGTWTATISGAPSAQFNGAWKLGFSAGGSYFVAKGSQKLVLGKATFAGATVTFHDLSGPASCLGMQAIGSYNWAVAGGKLRLKPLREPCAGRKFVLARTFTHVKSVPAA